MTEEESQETLGQYLKRVRLALPMSLRAVERATDGVTNGYLSQIESGHIKRPSPHVLHELSEAYGIDYRDLLVRARHQVPDNKTTTEKIPSLAGLPLRALSDLTEAEARQVADYIAWLKTRR